MPWLPKPKPSAAAAVDVFTLTPAQRVYGPGRPDDLGFITTAERALATPPPRFRDAKALKPDQWRKLMRDGGATNEAFTWQIEPALKSLADQGLTGDIPKSAFEEALARNRGTLNAAGQRFGADASPREIALRERIEVDRLLGKKLPARVLQEYNDLKNARRKKGGVPDGVLAEADYSAYVAPGIAKNYRQEVLILPASQGEGYKSHNWQNTNPVGHIRTTERVAADGRKVLHVEELQSDLHQEGAKHGYRGSTTKTSVAAIRAEYETKAQRYRDWAEATRERRLAVHKAELPGDVYGVEAHKLIDDPEGAELYRAAAEAHRRATNAEQLLSTQPPRAPLENWEEPFVRHVLQRAAKEGIDTVTFPTHATLHNALQNEGTQKFYDERLPNTIARVAKSLGLKVDKARLEIVSGEARRKLVQAVKDAELSLALEPAGSSARVIYERDLQRSRAALANHDAGGADVPSITLTPQAKSKLVEGVAMYGVPLLGAGVGLSLLFPDDAEAQVTDPGKAARDEAAFQEWLANMRGDTARNNERAQRVQQVTSEVNARLDAMGPLPGPLKIPVMGWEEPGAPMPERRQAPAENDPLRDYTPLGPSIGGEDLTQAAAPESGAGAPIGMGSGGPEVPAAPASGDRPAAGAQLFSIEPARRTPARGRWIDAAPRAGYPTAELQAMERAAREEQQRLNATPDFWAETVPASFRRENVVGSFLANQQVTDYDGRAAIAAGRTQAFNPFVEGYLDGFEDQVDRFADTLTQKEADALKRQILRERDDMRILSLSGVPGMLAQMAAGTIDPTSIIPSGVAWKAGDSLLMFAAKGAWMGATQAVVSENVLQMTQTQRTTEESALAVAGGVFFGGLIGTGAKSFFRAKPAVLDKAIDDLTLKGEDDPQFAFEREDAAAMDAARARAGSVGAAATPEDLKRGAAGYELADEFGLALVSAAGSAKGGAGLVEGLNPVVRLSQSPSRGAREAAAKLMESGMFLKGNMAGEASPQAVETSMRLWRGHEAKAVVAGRDAYKAFRKAGGSWSRTEFLEEVGRTLRRGDDHRDPHVKAAAQSYRQMFDTMKDEAIKLEMLPEDIGPETAASYYHRMWNRKALTSRPEHFKNMAAEYIANALEGLKRRAMELEVDLVRMKDETKAARDAMREAGKAATRERNALRSREGMRKAAQQRLMQASAAGDEKAMERAMRRIAELDEEIAFHKPLADARSGEYDAAKRTYAGVRGESKLPDEDMKLVLQARQILELENTGETTASIARMSATEIYQQLTGYDWRTAPPRLTMMQRGPLSERTFHIPDLYKTRTRGLEAAVEDFLVDDVEAVASRYMRVMSTDIEMTRAFGDPGMKKALDEVNASFDELVGAAEERVRATFADRAAKAGTDVDKAKLKTAIEKARRDVETRRRRDVRDLVGVRDVLRGNFGAGVNHEAAWVRGASFVRAWNYITLLGGMTVTAFSDVAGKVLSNGFLGIARDLVGPLMTDLKGVKIAAREARDYGIAVERALGARMASLADIGDAYGKGSSFDRAMNNITSAFSTVTGMRLWNDVMRTADYIIAQNRAIRVLEQVRDGKKSAGRDLRWLAWAGIDVKSSEAAAILDELALHGDVDGGMRLANTHLWENQDAARAFRAVMAKEAAVATVEVGAGDKLLAMHGELGKTIGQFRSFTFAAHQRVTLRAMQQLRQGDAAVGSWFVAATSLGMMVYALKMWDSLRDTSANPETWVREGLDRSGVFPMLFEAYNSSEKIIKPGEKHPLKMFFPGDASSRFQSRGPMGSLIGPSFGRADDVLALMGNLSDGKVKDTDLHAARKLVPFNNLFLMRQVFDRLEIEIGAAAGVEETAFSDRRQKAMAN